MTSAHTSRPISRPLRIAYLSEIFPSKSETWIHHEIGTLQKLGCGVRVFATHPKPQGLSPELSHLDSLTTYLPELSVEWRTRVKTLAAPNLLKPVLGAVLDDCPGLRRRVQVLRDLIYVSKLAPSIADFKPDVLFAHFAGTRANIALFLSLVSGIPFVMKMHAEDVFDRVALFRLKTARAAHIFAISDYNIGFIRTHYPDIGSARITRHACGIPLNEYPFTPARPANGIPIILAVGRLVPMKGFDVLLRASRILLDKAFHHRLVILGDGPERTNLEQLRGKLNISKVVDLRGYATPDEVRKSLRTAGLFVLPAVSDPRTGTRDGIPVALMEAMAAGVPVVSTAISGIPELIQDGVNGMLAPPNDAKALAQKILQWSEMSAVARAEMQSMARKKIEASHDVETLTSQLLATFENISRAQRAAATI